MQKWLRLTFVIVLGLSLSAGLIGCGKKGKKERIRSGRSARTGSGYLPDGTPRGGSSGNGSFSGQIFASQTAVDNFVSSWMDPYDIGSVESGDTGVFFDGRVDIGRFTSGSTSNTSIRSGSVEILIWDEFSGQQDPETGEAIPGILVDKLRLVGGTVRGSEVEVEFSDEFGSVYFIGEFDSRTFIGEVYFENTKAFDGGSPGSGTLGEFEIPACDFFICD